MAEKLGIGATFPSLNIATTDGGTMQLPDGMAGKYKVILFYRGHW